MIRKISLIVALAASACSTNEKQMAATIEGEHIYVESVDSAIYDKLYERLFDIHYNRTIALDHLVAQKLIMKEAVSRKIPVDSLLRLEVERKISKGAIDTLIAENNLQHGMPHPTAFGRNLDPYSEEGQAHLDGVLRRKLERDFVATLKQKYNVEILLTPPIPPKINTNGIVKYPLNPSAGSIEVLIVSDFACSICQEKSEVLKNIITKLSKVASFYYVPFSNLVSDEMIYSECTLSQKPNFFETFNVIFEEYSASDSLDLARISSKLTVDHSSITACMAEQRLQVVNKLKASFERLYNSKISGTPLLVIDGRVYYGEIGPEHVRAYIESIIKRRNS